MQVIIFIAKLWNVEVGQQIWGSTFLGCFSNIFNFGVQKFWANFKNPGNFVLVVKKLPHSSPLLNMSSILTIVGVPPKSLRDVSDLLIFRMKKWFAPGRNVCIRFRLIFRAVALLAFSISVLTTIMKLCRV